MDQFLKEPVENDGYNLEARVRNFLLADGWDVKLGEKYVDVASKKIVLSI